MRKIVVHRAGSHDQLQLEEHPDPIPGTGEVLVDVQAAGVNYADCVVRMGLYESAKKYVGWPITPGFEVAGAVAALGEGVTDLALGARVFGVTRFGGAGGPRLGALDGAASPRCACGQGVQHGLLQDARDGDAPCR